MKVVIGLGVSGLSCIDYLLQQGEAVIAMDSAQQPAGYQTLRAKHPDLPCFLGALDAESLNRADEVVVSPGVSLQQPILQACGKPLIGDIELLARVTNKPIYAITGSNGKSTVTSLLGEMAKFAGRKLMVAGNIGIPVLDCLNDDAEGYILELSSFQLDTAPSLTTKAAVVLNVTPDHLDRYPSFQDYLAAKQRIYQHCDFPVVNLDEPAIWDALALPAERITFSTTQAADYTVSSIDGELWLSAYGQRLLPVTAMKLCGEHHWQNALVALAMGEVMQLPMTAMLQALTQFVGLPHRCQWVRTVNEVRWYNDSKGTNIGATAKAITSVAQATTAKLILLAGGVGKGADFAVLAPCLKRYVSQVIVFGRDAALLADAWKKACPVFCVDSLAAAVQLAQQYARSGDSVLLSPACASFDMFKHFEDRGQQFVALVNAL